MSALTAQGTTCSYMTRRQSTLKFKTRDRRAIEMPGQPRSGSTPPNDLVRKEGVKVMHRIDLRSGGVGPADAERLHALFHLAEGGDGLFSHGVGARLAVANDVFAAGNDEGCGGPARRHGERKRMEGRLARRIDLWTDIDTRDRIDRAVKKLPARKRRHVVFVEFGEPLFGERRRGP